MSIHRQDDGSVIVRWYENGRGTPRRQRTFKPTRTRGAQTALQQAQAFDDEIKRRLRLDGVVRLDQGTVTLGEFVETYWRLHAVPNLAASTRDVYGRMWANHLRPRLGGRQLRQITPKVIVRLRSDLEKAGLPEPTVRKSLAVLQSILAFAVVEEHLPFNPAGTVKKPVARTSRTAHVFLPPEVERIRAALGARDATLVSLLAYAGPRPEEALRVTWQDVGSEAVRFDGRKTGGQVRWTPLLAALAQDLREWRMVCGRPAPSAPVFPAHDGNTWRVDDWRNWRRRVWQQDWRLRTGEKRRELHPITPAGSRPRDLRGSYVTLRLYGGVPLTTIAREVGASVVTLDRHYAGVIANWDGKITPADEQIAAARGRVVDVSQIGENGG